MAKNVTNSSSTLPAHKWVVVPSVLFDMKPVFTLQICKDKYYKKSTFDNYDHENNDGDDNNESLIDSKYENSSEISVSIPSSKGSVRNLNFKNKFRS